MREDVLNKLYNFREKAFSFINEAESLLNRAVLLVVIVVILVWVNLSRIIELAVSENRIKSNLISELEKLSGKKAEVSGDVFFKNNPEPTIFINKVRVVNNSKLTDQDYFQAGVIRSSPNVFQALIGRADFKDVYMEDVKLSLDSSGQDEVTENFSLKSIAEGGKLYGKNLKFKNLEISTNKTNPLDANKVISRKLFFPSLELIPNPKDSDSKYQILGSINSTEFNQIYYFDIKLKGDIGKKSSYETKIYSNDSELTVKGNIDFENFILDGEISGKATGIINKLLSKVGASEEFIDKVRDNDESDIRGKFSYSGGIFSVIDMTAESKVLSLSLNSKTEIKDKISSSVNLKVNNFDYSQLFKTYLETISEKKAKKVEKDFKKKLEEFFLFSVKDDVNFLLNLEAPSIKFFQQKSGSLSLVAILRDNKFNIKKLSANLPGQADLSFAGEVEINKVAKQLKGSSRLIFKGENMDELLYAIDTTMKEKSENRFKKFFIDAKAFLYSQNIHFREIIAKINDDALAGQVIADYSDQFKASAAFNFSKLNLDKYLDNNNNADLGIPTNENPLSGKFDFIRVVDSVFDKLDVSLIADNMVKSGHNYTDFSLYAQISPGKTEVKDIYFNSENMGVVKGNATLDLSDFQPKLDINLVLDKYDADFLIYGELVNQDNKYNFDGKWSTEKVTFSKFNNFLGKMNIKIGELRIYHFLANNFALKSHSEEGKFVIDQARADLFGNKIDFKGYLTTEYPSFNISFVASELQSDKFMKDTLNLDQIYSIFNMSGVLASTGYSIEQMIQNLKGNISIATKGFSVSGFDLETVGKALPLAKRREYVKLIAEELLNKGDTEFNFFIGAFNIDDGKIIFNDLPIAGPNVQGAKVTGLIDLNSWSASIDSTMRVITSDKGTFELKGKTTGKIPHLRTQWDTTGMLTYWESKFFGGR